MDSRKTQTAVAVAIGLFMMAVPMFAHHGTGISYDSSKQFTMTGTITEFRYANPHPQLYLDVKDDKGNIEHWGLEIGPNPAALIKDGWSKKRSEAALKPGTVATVTVSPSRAGGTIGVLNRVVINGEILSGYDFGVRGGGQRGQGQTGPGGRGQ